MRDFDKSDAIKAYIAGYEQGHNDTVESCYGNYEEKAEEYVEEKYSLSPEG